MCSYTCCYSSLFLDTISDTENVMLIIKVLKDTHRHYIQQQNKHRVNLFGVYNNSPFMHVISQTSVQVVEHMYKMFIGSKITSSIKTFVLH